MPSPITGFSKLTKEEKLNWLATNYTDNSEATKTVLKSYWNRDADLQQLHDEFIENTISNFYLPLAIAPNFLINDRLLAIPMAIEESSVVAAASRAAKFWYDRGGFKAKVMGTEKIGQIHFMYKGDRKKLEGFFGEIKPKLLSSIKQLTASMKKRGGGIDNMQLLDKTTKLTDYFQLHCTFETKDAMGANFINTCLEQIAKTFKEEAHKYPKFDDKEKEIEIVMSILSNYVPNCIVKAEVACPIEDLTVNATISPQEFAKKLVSAISIANAEPHRAVTHNKGVMNGIDAVVLATGNDFRAVEAGVHAYASKDGQYKSLTHASIEGDLFRFWIELPLALGTVGGLTSLHPLAKLSLEILQKPSAQELMQIVAVAGLAQNFAAISALITTGIQQGHMKMHLANILNQLGATEAQKKVLEEHFGKNSVSHSAVVEAFHKLKKHK